MLQLCSVPKLRYIWVINEADLSHAGADLPNDFRTKWSRHCPNVAVSFKGCEDHIASDPCDWMNGTIWESNFHGLMKTMEMMMKIWKNFNGVHYRSLELKGRGEICNFLKSEKF